MENKFEPFLGLAKHEWPSIRPFNVRVILTNGSIMTAKIIQIGCTYTSWQTLKEFAEREKW